MQEPTLTPKPQRIGELPGMPEPEPFAPGWFVWVQHPTERQQSYSGFIAEADSAEHAARQWLGQIPISLLETVHPVINVVRAIPHTTFSLSVDHRLTER